MRIHRNLRRSRETLQPFLLFCGLLAAALLASACNPAAPTPARFTPTATPTLAATATQGAPPLLAPTSTPAPLSPPETGLSPLPSVTVPPSSTPSPSPIPPSPTPTPTLPPPPATGSKLGVHGIWANRIPEFTQTLAAAGVPFRVVKAVDDLSWLAEIKRLSPGTITVGRLTHDQEGAPRVNDPNTDLEDYAAVLMAPILNKLQAQPALREAVDYWEVTNEPLGGGAPAEAYARLAQLMLHCLDIAEANGLKLALFGFSAGTPEWVDWVAIVDTGLFARARAGGHILTLHEGVFGDDPIDKWWNEHFVDGDGNPIAQDTGVTAPGGWIPGGPVLEGAGALTLRYRFLYHLLEAQDQVVPLFVSEFYAGGGYDPLNKVDVIARMHWYDLQIAADAYVLGFAPFTLGPTAGWEQQDYEPFYTGGYSLVAYMMGQPAD
jgi:hypothetical protein